MGFRQKNKTAEVRWLRTHRHALVSAGIPVDVFDAGRWNYVLLHAADDFGSGWDLTWIDDDQARALLSLLQSFYGEATGFCLVADLTRRCAAT
ncbi:MAG: hypothetical protein ACRBN8_34225 [Nannocystales bacterium]